MLIFCYATTTHDLILKSIDLWVHLASSSFRNLITLKFMYIKLNITYFWLVSHIIHVAWVWRRITYFEITFSFVYYLLSMAGISRFIFIWTWLARHTITFLYFILIDKCKLITIWILIVILELLVILIVFFINYFYFWRIFIIIKRFLTQYILFRYF